TRRLLYAGTTIAAALLVAIFLPRDNVPVAQNADQADAKKEDAAKAETKKADKDPAEATVGATPKLNSGKSDKAQSLPNVPDEDGKDVPANTAHTRAIQDTAASEGTKAELERGTRRTKTPKRSPDELAENFGARLEKSARGKSKESSNGKEPRMQAGNSIGAGGVAPATASVPPGVPTTNSAQPQVSKEYLAATFTVRLAAREALATLPESTDVDDAVFRKVQDRLTQQGIAIEPSRVERRNETVRSQAAEAAGRLRDQANEAQLHWKGHKASPVVLYVEATRDQATQLLATLDSDPAFRRTDGDVPRQFASGGGGASYSSIDTTKRPQVAGKIDQKAALDLIADANAGGKSRGARAYRLSRADSFSDSSELKYDAATGARQIRKTTEE
ncbi:MAG: hypothetical protein MI757_09610, partial [Pirellulales bacterium]|nr:hypothetical protein [Pirellulales bacterium]